MRHGTLRSGRDDYLLAGESRATWPGVFHPWEVPHGGNNQELRQNWASFLYEQFLLLRNRPRSSWSVAVYCMLMLMASSCERLDVVRHPTPENAPPTDALRLTRDTWSEMGEAELSSWKRVRDRIHATRIDWSIGSDATGHDLFGEILAVGIDTLGRVVVLDDQRGIVRIFDESGTLVDQFGDLGDGPAGLRTSWGFGLQRDGSIAVYLDARRVKYFAYDGGEWSLTHAAVLPMTVESVCEMYDGRVFVHGAHDRSDDRSPALFYEAISVSDGDFRGFGRRYLGNWFAADDMSLGRLACLDVSNQIVFAHEMLPTIEAFSAETGAMQWVSRPADYIQMDVIEHPQGSVEYHWGHGDALVAALATPSQHVLVQYARAIRGVDVRSIRSYLINPVSGLGAFIGDTLPIIKAFHENGYIAVLQDPFLRLEARRFTTGR